MPICKALIKDLSDEQRVEHYSYQFKINASAEFKELVQYFQMDKIYKNEILESTIREIVREYTKELETLLQTIADSFYPGCKVRAYEGNATFMLNRGETTIFFSPYDIFDSIFLTIPIDDTLVDLNIVKSVLVANDLQLRKILLRQTRDYVRRWNDKVLQYAEEIKKWLKYQEELVQQNLEEIVKDKIEDLTKVANYLQTLTEKEIPKMELNCFQAYILNGLLHEIMHDIMVSPSETYVNLSANYIINQLFDISHLEIEFPVDENTYVNIKGKETTFRQQLLYSIRQFTRNPSSFRKFLTRLPEGIAETFQEKELDILLGNNVTLPNYLVDKMNKTMTPYGQMVICNSLQDWELKVKQVKKAIRQVLENFNKSIGSFVVYKGTTKIVRREDKVDVNYADLSKFSLVDRKTFQRKVYNTINLMKSYFSPLILRHLHKTKEIARSKWKNKSLVKGLLYGTPIRKQYFKSSVGKIFVIVDISGSMNDMFILTAVSSVYSTLHQHFSRIDLVMIQFADDIADKRIYRNLSVDKLFDITVLSAGGNTRFSSVTNAIATNTELGLMYKQSELVVLVSDCEFNDNIDDYKSVIPFKSLVIFYPDTETMFSTKIRQKPKSFPYTWIRTGLVISKEKLDPVLQTFS